MNAVIGALDTHTAMSTQALGSETVRSGIKGAVLGPAQLHQSLRAGRHSMNPRRAVTNETHSAASVAHLQTESIRSWQSANAVIV